MLVGTHEHRVDSKGRVVLPSRFREGLGEELIATVGIDPCVSIYGLGGWEGLFNRLSSLSSSRASHRDLKRLLMASAVQVEPDSMGRLLVPSYLREHAKITRDVYIIGVGDHVEIWDREEWDRRRARLMDELPSIVEEVDGL
ncbi:MraZ protein [Thermanaerovibrio acidaminovorans DSM 6589]|uniref:Transcriptional regulator MraZ n=1 Tax=Thermanaerovibrio acidaminovorans (strain ATCC 49978 / DSM 6589 / Su883) TaxID=525903 RepID=D1B9Z3_THEAS|nr:MraZ protein [Thermanaerovibrio acidaminovorans DSM 6589]